ncbi:ferritin family protein [Aminipila butyrica]|uniref:Ferritin family protein n=1 Tax=Aminipila butyrica TaxID=433296 RepID=A0A858BY48_9FIRM|nr:ferritin family protein [Aminipila butyrica]QIB70045.1 ferritin family protein [Aminipila butyrica]
MNSIERAIKLEIDGRNFYLQQAESATNNGLKSIFHTLAEEERIHAQILQNKAEALSYELVDTYAEIKNLFLEIEEYRDLIALAPDAVDAYSTALENERRSISLYTEMLKEATNEEERQVINFIIEQEKGHEKMMEQLVEMVSRPREWVESAEFGIREEY